MLSGQFSRVCLAFALAVLTALPGRAENTSEMLLEDLGQLDRNVQILSLEWLPLPRGEEPKPVADVTLTVSVKGGVWTASSQPDGPPFVVPLGTVIELTLVSEDLFYEMQVEGSQNALEAVPGRPATAFVTFETPGEVRLTCTFGCPKRFAGAPLVLDVRDE